MSRPPRVCAPPARRIALIHAVAVAMEPIHAAFKREWPEAILFNVLDDSLSGDRAAAKEMSAALADRMVALARYGRTAGADAILFTCSAFGPAIERAAAELPIPVLKPNEAMFEAALGYGQRIGMLATFQPAVATMEDEFRQDAQRLGSPATLTTRVANGAMEALRAGDQQTHDRLIAQQAGDLGDVDAVMLAQFSMAGAQAAVQAICRQPVLSSPAAAVAKLRKLLLDHA